MRQYDLPLSFSSLARAAAESRRCSCAVRFRRHLGPRHPQHRIRRHERAHRGDRGAYGPGRQGHGLRRLGQRRRVALARRRHDVPPGLRQAGRQSIGAIAIDPSNAKTVWVGTGESWTRNSVSIGDGIYKSDRRRRHLDARGAARVGAHCGDRGRSDRRPDRLCVRAGEALERLDRARSLQDIGWRTARGRSC